MRLGIQHIVAALIVLHHSAEHFVRFLEGKAGGNGIRVRQLGNMNLFLIVPRYRNRLIWIHIGDDFRSAAIIVAPAGWGDLVLHACIVRRTFRIKQCARVSFDRSKLLCHPIRENNAVRSLVPLHVVAS
ncbi:hypothetical protein D3C84_1003460 [compost metagenome]